MAWKLTNENGIGILEFDHPDSPEVNILTTPNLVRLKEILQEIPNNQELKALLFVSAKKRIFIAGADINEIQGISNEKDAFDKAEQGKEVFQLIEDLSIPTISVINGACLGGGYELSLACDFCVASFSKNVKIGLPEVNLGILPGFGGSIRLPKRIGLLKALPLILAGKIMGPEDALKKGVVDRLFPEKTLRQNAIEFAQEILAKGIDSVRKKKKKDLMSAFLEDTSLGRKLVFKRARKDVQKKSKGFYPAPFQIIDLIEKTYGGSAKTSFREESQDFSKLGATNISKNLIKLFFLSEKYKKFKWTSTNKKFPKVKKCGVIGAGVMGGGIAQRVSYKDIPVRVKDINEKALAGALKEASSIYQGALKRRRIKKYAVDAKMSLISVGLTNHGIRHCDMIIEAVVENLIVKQKVFKELDAVASPDAVLASNTSSLPVTQMAKGTKHPERIVGIHFFNPVHRMPLVEVIRAEKTSDETLERAIQFSRSLGKTVIVTQDKPGFLVNRLLLPYLNEAAFLLEEGMAPETIDKVATAFGMPMGPVELVDQVGIDVGYKVGLVLQEAFGDRMKVAPILETVKSHGLLGKKSGSGFYLYKGKEKTVNPEAIPSTQTCETSEDDAIKRMIYVMINEAARCLEEKVIDSPGTVDIGMVMGTGFPPFRAGLLHYADSIGVDKIASELERFQREVNRVRFEPCAYLVELAKSGKKFYNANRQ